MTIVTIPHPSLTKKSKSVDLDAGLAKFVTKLERALKFKQNPAGVGLSAPQVAKNWRLFSIFLDHDRPESITSYINPRVIDRSDQLTLSEDKDGPFLEGCLSIPKIYGPVKRFEWLELEYDFYDRDKGEFAQAKQRFSDFPARVVQHELDHLDGILFTQRAIEQGLELYQDVNGKLEKMVQ